MTIKIRKARRRDIRKLSGRLREADAQELLAAGNASVESALAYSFDHSTIRRTVELDNLPVALFGLRPSASILGDEANIWFLGTPELSRIKKTFVKMSREVVNEWLTCYTRLWNIVDSRYLSSITWLQATGAVFDDGSAVPGFRRFSITRDYDKEAGMVFSEQRKAAREKRRMVLWGINQAISNYGLDTMRPIFKALVERAV